MVPTQKGGFGPILIRVHPKSGLRKLGWFRSFRDRRSVDRAGNPIPWWTYPFVEFLEERLTKSLRVLEFGYGGSTLWLSRRVKEVVSYENDSSWAASVSSQLPDASRVILCDSLEQAAASLDARSDSFDVIIIDAGNRVEIAQHVLRKVTAQGVIIWDNTDGPDWPQIWALLAQHGYREISFSGLVPREVSLHRTTLFYRPGNILGVQSAHIQGGSHAFVKVVLR